MAAPPPEVLRLATDAAVEFRDEIIRMLTNNQNGEVAAIIGFNEIKIVGRPEKPVWRRKLERGRWAVIEKVR